MIGLFDFEKTTNLVDFSEYKAAIERHDSELYYGKSVGTSFEPTDSIKRVFKYEYFIHVIPVSIKVPKYNALN